LLYNANLLTKIAFPRAVLPIATLLPPMVDLALGSILAVAAAVIAGDSIPLLGLLLAVPVGLAQLVTVAAGLALFFSALIVRFRDVAVLVGFGLQVVLLASPVAYPPDLVPSAWRTAVYVNPLAGCLGLIRYGLVGTPLPSGPRLLLSAAMAVIILLGGLLHFRRREREFADII
jgi:ABC-type polysaccharide/polyol phosphate export permease